MKTLSSFLIFVLLCFASCVSEQKEFSLRVITDNSEVDSLKIFLEKPDYDSWEKIGEFGCNKTVVDTILKGKFFEDCVLKADFGEKASPLYFVANELPLTITMKGNVILLSGCKENAELLRFIRLKRNIIKECLSIRLKHRKMINDTTLTNVLERDMFKQDSLLQDSLNKATQTIITRNDLLSKIVKFNLKK